MRIKSKTNKTPRRIISATKTEGHNYTIIRAYVSLRYVIRVCTLIGLQPRHALQKNVTCFLFEIPLELLFMEQEVEINIKR